MFELPTISRQLQYMVLPMFFHSALLAVFGGVSVLLFTGKEMQVQSGEVTFPRSYKY